MGNRPETLWTPIELLAAVGNLAFARRSDAGLAAGYVALGSCVGLSYRAIEDEYVGRFRDRPLRYLAFTVLWIAITRLLLPTDDESADLSFAGGVGLGSVCYRLLDRS